MNVNALSLCEEKKTAPINAIFHTLSKNPELYDILKDTAPFLPSNMQMLAQRLIDTYDFFQRLCEPKSPSCQRRNSDPKAFFNIMLKYMPLNQKTHINGIMSVLNVFERVMKDRSKPEISAPGNRIEEIIMRLSRLNEMSKVFKSADNVKKVMSIISSGKGGSDSQKTETPFSFIEDMLSSDKLDRLNKILLS